MFEWSNSADKISLFMDYIDDEKFFDYMMCVSLILWKLCVYSFLFKRGMVKYDLF